MLLPTTSCQLIANAASLNTDEFHLINTITTHLYIVKNATQTSVKHRYTTNKGSRNKCNTSLPS